ncbi:MAG: hypothetical protein IJW63_10470 [Lachnospiraceae bacterium]|nr:hypothetical protein [Lachnospiraceae bacterium]
MRNIFVEGIQGMGKSTLTNALAKKYPEYRVCREGDYNPVELAWCTWMTQEEYEAVLDRYPDLVEEIKANTTVEYMGGYLGQEDARRYVITYTRILTDIPGFHKDLERFEIYNGRKSLEEIKEIVLSRYEKFNGQGYIFECSFFQNIVEDLILFHQLSDDEIVQFYRELYAKVDKKSFHLYYLYSDEVEENIRIIREERCDAQGNQMWYPLMLGFLVESPYGKAHGYQGFEDMIGHFKHRQRVEMRIIEEIVGENAEILESKGWDINE